MCQICEDGNVKINAVDAFLGEGVRRDFKHEVFAPGLDGLPSAALDFNSAWGCVGRIIC
ncbi:hypothetical protein HRbin07_00538 [bacterium HR07]|nr:hypothetical protein HRbin07_00538 [bacterium HR07]